MRYIGTLESIRITPVADLVSALDLGKHLLDVPGGKAVHRRGTDGRKLASGILVGHLALGTAQCLAGPFRRCQPGGSCRALKPSKVVVCNNDLEALTHSGSISSSQYVSDAGGGHNVIRCASRTLPA
jgi:hypothetical protein